MPCDSVTTQSINLKNAMDTILVEALKAEGFRITVQTAKTVTATADWQTVTWTKGIGLEIKGMGGAQAVIDKVTKAYSTQAVSWAAARAGWTVKKTADNQLTVTRR